MEPLKSIDIDRLMEASGSDPALAEELVELYLELTGKEVVLLQKAAEAGDTAAVHAIAHKCAGSSVTCGMKELAETLRNLEYETFSGLPDDLSERLNQINKQLDVIRTEAETFLESVKPS